MNVKWIKIVLIILLVAICAGGAVLLYQFKNDRLESTRIDENVLTSTDVETGIMYTTNNEQQMSVFVRRRVVGDDKRTTTWLTLEKENAPYRIANISVAISGGSFGRIGITDGAHNIEESEVYDINDSLRYNFKTSIRDNDGQLMIQCTPEQLDGKTVKITWTFDVVRDNFIGWPVRKNEVVVFDVVW